MPRITVRKCPFTGKVFHDDKTYRKHLLALRKQKTTIRNARIRKRTAEDKLFAKIEHLSSIEEVEYFVDDHYTDILLSAYCTDDIDLMIADGTIVNDFRLQVGYQDHCSNTHCCPRNGVTNFDRRKEGAPTGYPGYTGFVDYEIYMPNKPKQSRPRPSYDFYRALSTVGIYTGTGGARGRSSEGFRKYHFAVTLFLEDFPGLKRAHFKDLLAGTRSKSG